MAKVYIGIDNGTTGSVGIISNMDDNKRVLYFHTPKKKELNYTKTKRFIHRVDGTKLKNLISSSLIELGCIDPQDVMVFIERPFTNIKAINTMLLSVRALEATLIVIELLGLPYMYVDSKEWQRHMLPSGLEKKELKMASMQVGQRLFPSVDFSDFDDADGLLIAEYYRRKGF